MTNTALETIASSSGNKSKRPSLDFNTYVGLLCSRPYYTKYNLYSAIMSKDTEPFKLQTLNVSVSSLYLYDTIHNGFENKQKNPFSVPATLVSKWTASTCSRGVTAFYARHFFCKSGNWRWRLSPLHCRYTFAVPKGGQLLVYYNYSCSGLSWPRHCW